MIGAPGDQFFSGFGLEYLDVPSKLYFRVTRGPYFSFDV